jgi:hypothetical protein
MDQPGLPAHTSSTAGRRAAGQPCREAAPTAVNALTPPRPIVGIQFPGRRCAVRSVVADRDLSGSQPAPRHWSATSHPVGRTGPLAQANAVPSSCRAYGDNVVMDAAPPNWPSGPTAGGAKLLVDITPAGPGSPGSCRRRAVGFYGRPGCLWYTIASRQAHEPPPATGRSRR